MYKWKCESCDWKGDEFVFTPAYEFLKLEEDTCEEDYIETCPKCEKMAIENLR